MTAAIEESALRAVLAATEDIETVAATFPEGDGRREALLGIVAVEWQAYPPIRVRVAATVLNVKQGRIRDWLRDGVLVPVVSENKEAVEAARFLVVWQLMRDLRRAGQNGLLREVWRRLSDESLLDRDDLAESLEQMRRGEGDVYQFRDPESC